MNASHDPDRPTRRGPAPASSAQDLPSGVPLRAAPVSPLHGVRLVALDLDGTLLPSSKRLTDRAVGVVRDLGAAGVGVALATGKGWALTERYARELGLLSPHVALEGALVAEVRAEGEARTLHSRTLDASLFRRVHDLVADLRLGSFACTDRRLTRVTAHLADRIDQIRIWDPEVVLVDRWHDDTPGFILHLVGEPAAVAEARRRVTALDLAHVELFHAEFWDGYDQLQVRPHGIGKHHGLRHVLDRAGLSAEHLLAAGDWWNDVEMLRMARVSVAPSNAVEGVRTAATHVAPGTCDDDAVVRFLERALATL